MLVANFPSVGARITGDFIVVASSRRHEYQECHTCHLWSKRQNKGITHVVFLASAKTQHIMREGHFPLLIRLRCCSEMLSDATAKVMHHGIKDPADVRDHYFRHLWPCSRVVYLEQLV